MAKYFKTLILCLALAACSSTPTWKDMSETEIANWKDIGVSVEQVQGYLKAGLSAASVGKWQENGFVNQQDILTWAKAQFSPDNAKQWREASFSLDDAKAWSKEKFTPENAVKWRDGGFDLSQALHNREKGLQPVK